MQLEGLPETLIWDREAARALASAPAWSASASVRNGDRVGGGPLARQNRHIASMTSCAALAPWPAWSSMASVIPFDSEAANLPLSFARPS